MWSAKKLEDTIIWARGSQNPVFPKPSTHLITGSTTSDNFKETDTYNSRAVETAIIPRSPRTDFWRSRDADAQNKALHSSVGTVLAVNYTQPPSQ